MAYIDAGKQALQFALEQQVDFTVIGPDDPLLLVVCHFNINYMEQYSVGVPHSGVWREVLNSDAEIYGGSGTGNLGAITAEHGDAQVVLPPLATLMFEFVG